MRSGFRPDIVIDCMLSTGDDGLTADGCIYQLSSEQPQLLNPEQLTSGEYVKIRLWLPDEQSYIVVDLAEIQWIQNHWIKVDVLIISQKHQERLKQYIVAQGHFTPPLQRMSEQILIRA